jgi:small multidrug resistance pump
MPAAIGFLVLTVVFETLGTACLQASQQFTRPVPSIGVLLGFAASFWFAAEALRTLPLAVACATWSGLGILADTAVGWAVFGQRIGWPALGGLLLVCAGLVVMHAFSGTPVAPSAGSGPPR